MTNYPEIRKMLSLFGVEVGLSDEAAQALLQRTLRSEEWRKKFEDELISAFSDASTPWTELLCNEEYEVSEPGSSEEARQTAAELLWNATFPDRPLP